MSNKPTKFEDVIMEFAVAAASRSIDQAFATLIKLGAPTRVLDAFHENLLVHEFIVTNLEHLAKGKTVEEICKDLAPKITETYREVMQNPVVYERVKRTYGDAP